MNETQKRVIQQEINMCRALLDENARAAQAIELKANRNKNEREMLAEKLASLQEGN